MANDTSPTQHGTTPGGAGDDSRPIAEIGPPDIPGYKTLGMLGRGGMGVVYKAEQTRLERLVAIKTLRIDPALDQVAREQVDRFLQEARALAKLGGHENLVQVHDIVEDAEGCDHIIMEFVEGVSLAQRLRDGPPLSMREAVRATRDAARALQRAHDSGIIHRDVKPSNIMMTPAGVVKVMDFGVARVQGAAVNTASGQMIGTPLYMSPEQIRGKGVDGRSDIYSLSVMLYHLVCGRPPFMDTNALSLMFQHVNDAPASPASIAGGLDPRLEAVILRGMAKSPENRFQAAGELAEALDSLLRDLGHESAAMAAPSSPMAGPSTGSSAHLEQTIPADAPTGGSSLPAPPEFASFSEGAASDPRLVADHPTLPGGGPGPEIESKPEIEGYLSETPEAPSLAGETPAPKPRVGWLAGLRLGLLGWMLPTAAWAWFVQQVLQKEGASEAMAAFQGRLIGMVPGPMAWQATLLREGLAAGESRPAAEAWLFLQILLVPVYWWMLRRVFFHQGPRRPLLKLVVIPALLYGAAMLASYWWVFASLASERWPDFHASALPFLLLPWPWLVYRLVARPWKGNAGTWVLGPLAAAMAPVVLWQGASSTAAAGVVPAAICLGAQLLLLAWSIRSVSLAQAGN